MLTSPGGPGSGGNASGASSVNIFPFSSVATDPIRNFRFLVEFLPHDQTSTAKVKFKKTLGFTNVSGFGMQVDPIAYREGGYNTAVHQLPGQTTFEPINFTRGQTLGSTQNSDWMRQLFSVISGRAQAGAGHDFRCNIDVSVLSHPNPAGTTAENGAAAKNPWELHVSMRFRIYNAWIQRLVYGDLQAAGSLMVEGMTVVHEGFDVNYANDYKTSAATFTI